MALALPESKRQSMERKYTDSQVKKKFPDAAVSKQNYAESLLGYERTHDN